MDYFYIGTVALNYWMEKYFHRIWRPKKDTDITSDTLTYSELRSKYPFMDILPLEYERDYFYNNEGYYVIDNGKCYATPEYLLLTYHKRLVKFKYDYIKYLADLDKIYFLKQICEKRGTLEKTKELLGRHKEINMQILFPYNEYLHRIMPYMSSEMIIGGEFALMYYYEICGKVYNFMDLDIHLYSAKKSLPFNKYGSRVIHHEESVPYTIIDGFKLQTLSSIEEQYPHISIPQFIKERFLNN